jgi:hypothetical protein
MFIRALILLVSLAPALSGAVYETNAYVETVAGSAFYGHVDGVGTMTMFSGPRAIAVDSMTNVFVWDSANHAIRKITADLTVSTVVSNLNDQIESTAPDGDGILYVTQFSGGGSKRLWRWSPARTDFVNFYQFSGNDTHPAGVVRTRPTISVI